VGHLGGQASPQHPLTPGPGSAHSREDIPSREFTYIHSGLLPGLREHGISEDQIGQMLIRNPRDFFSAQ
jgi:predicted metal-dependent phosphotriesterase family hydrolase